MQIAIFLGIFVFAIGILLCIFTTRWNYGLYTSSNRPISCLGLLLIALGIGIIILFAYLNGQFD
ncbi:hypothetical protein [Apilactobacillus ozensis]|uniref:hypothetical protein n=1 Tax=Apilactobacillus ozensis TaxID=866801 RepID=UPI00200B0047|nr:hypothetical protein [Apilactobacillus ozensis]MCK8606991.1 hypothetical protein [Apilactobacillus ozensis]